MLKNSLSQKIDSKSVQLNQQSVEKGIANNKLSKFIQEQEQRSSANKEERFQHQPEKKLYEKGDQLTDKRLYHQNERSDFNKQLHTQKISSTERQKAQEKLIQDSTKNLEYIAHQQKEIMSSIIKNIESTTDKKNSNSYTNLSILQDIDVRKPSNNDKIFCQWKQENKSTIYQNSFSSLGTISEESSQKSESSQYLISSDKNFTNSSLNLNGKEDKTEYDYSDEKDRKNQEQMMLLISCLVILALSYLYFAITQ